MEEKKLIMKKTSENYLEKKPVRADIAFSEKEGIVTLEIENKGLFNRLAQRFFKKPKISYIHLDEMGSFIWPLLDGKKDIIEIGKLVEERFGEKANPLYDRRAEYIKRLASYGFVVFK